MEYINFEAQLYNKISIFRGKIGFLIIYHSTLRPMSGEKRGRGKRKKREMEAGREREQDRKSRGREQECGEMEGATKVPALMDTCAGPHSHMIQRLPVAHILMPASNVDASTSARLVNKGGFLRMVSIPKNGFP